MAYRDYDEGLYADHYKEIHSLTPYLPPVSYFFLMKMMLCESTLA